MTKLDWERLKRRDQRNQSWDRYRGVLPSEGDAKIIAEARDFLKTCTPDDPSPFIRDLVADLQDPYWAPTVKQAAVVLKIRRSREPGVRMSRQDRNRKSRHQRRTGRGRRGAGGDSVGDDPSMPDGGHLDGLELDAAGNPAAQAESPDGRRGDRDTR